jgi:energy-converting hydrogenase B subunit D
VEAVTLLEWLFDGLLGFGLVWLSWRAMTSLNLFKAIVLFIAFGLLMSLAWVRLGTTDVALAEAAIGAGLTGALLMAALAKLQDASIVASNDDDDQSHIHNVSNDDSKKGTGQ